MTINSSFDTNHELFTVTEWCIESLTSSFSCRQLFILLTLSPSTVLPLQIKTIIITMSYAAGIITAITGLKDRTGSSSIAIKKTMQASMPKDKKWMNAAFLAALKKMVADGVLVQNKSSYKLGAKAKKAPKKKAAAPKKKSAPKKKAVSSINRHL